MCTILKECRDIAANDHIMNDDEEAVEDGSAVVLPSDIEDALDGEFVVDIVPVELSVGASAIQDSPKVVVILKGGERLMLPRREVI